MITSSFILHLLFHPGLKPRSRSELETTVSELTAMAAARHNGVKEAIVSQYDARLSGALPR
jgi:hypothetical protein